MKRITIMTLAATMLVAFAAGAATGATRYDRREARQYARVQQGVRSGALTRREARVLLREQRRIHRVERRVRADGMVTWRERARMSRAQDRASWRIYRLEHNRWSRRWW